MSHTDSPTKKTYESLNRAYEFFNHQLFGNSLPLCLITYQRHKGSFGYFSAARFGNKASPKAKTDEIALNPVHFATQGPKKVLSTLVHEMVHLWQHHCGNPPRHAYHDRQWASKMREVGLIPSDTGKEGGKETGQKVSHFVPKDGAYDKAFKLFESKNTISLYYDVASEEESKITRKKAASKTKYTCPECELNAWAKPDANLVCGDCEAVMVGEAPGDAG